MGTYVLSVLSPGFLAGLDLFLVRPSRTRAMHSLLPDLPQAAAAPGAYPRTQRDAVAGGVFTLATPSFCPSYASVMIVSCCAATKNLFSSNNFDLLIDDVGHCGSRSSFVPEGPVGPGAAR